MNNKEGDDRFGTLAERYAAYEVYDRAYESIGKVDATCSPTRPASRSRSPSQPRPLTLTADGDELRVRRYEDELRAGTVNVRKRERTDRERLEASIRRE